MTYFCLEARLHVRFSVDAIFVALFNTTFVTSVDWRRFHCNFWAIRVGYLLQFPPNRRRVASSFQNFETTAISAATNRTEFAASLHLRFLSRARARQKFHRKVRQKAIWKNVDISSLYLYESFNGDRHKNDMRKESAIR